MSIRADITATTVDCGAFAYTPFRGRITAGKAKENCY